MLCIIGLVPIEKQNGSCQCCSLRPHGSHQPAEPFISGFLEAAFPVIGHPMWMTFSHLCVHFGHWPRAHAARDSMLVTGTQGHRGQVWFPRSSVCSAIKLSPWTRLTESHLSTFNYTPLIQQNTLLFKHRLVFCVHPEFSWAATVWPSGINKRISWNGSSVS